MNRPADSLRPSPLRRKPVVGLIGGIGAGKSTVAARLKELGAAIIDADRTGHETLTEPDVVARLTKEFGSSILGSDGEIDRVSLGKVVFADPEKRRQLESIVHPRMLERFVHSIDHALSDERVPLIVLDAAILLEVGWDGVCDHIVYVDAPREVRLQRLSASRGWDEAELARRESAQWPADKKQARADFVINNGGAPEDCRAQVDELFAQWTRTPVGTHFSNQPSR